MSRANDLLNKIESFGKKSHRIKSLEFSGPSKQLRNDHNCFMLNSHRYNNNEIYAELTKLSEKIVKKYNIRRSLLIFWAQ
jgi:hypothetical protein